MFIDEFFPVPQVGCSYFTHDKKLFTVTGIIIEAEDVILVHAKGQDDKSYEFNAEQWNELGVSEAYAQTIMGNDSFAKKDIIENYQDILYDVKRRREEGRALKWKCGIINEFLWICAGVDRDLLRTCKSDWASKSGLGGNIFMTALLTAMSMGFAIHMITDNLFFVVIIGILFGLLIFSLDRFIINTMYSDGKCSFSWKEFVSGLPRIIISIVLGLIIAIPIEIQVFRGAINDYIQEYNTKAVLKSPEVIAIDNQVEAIRQETIELDSCIKLYEREYYMEVNNPMRSGVGNRAKYVETKITDSKERRDYLKSVSDSLRKEQRNLVLYSSYSDKPSLSQNIHALYAVTGHDKILFFIRTFILLFCIIIQVIPLLFKMMMTNGVYDELLKQEQSCTEKLLRIKTL